MKIDPSMMASMQAALNVLQTDGPQAAAAALRRGWVPAPRALSSANSLLKAWGPGSSLPAAARGLDGFSPFSTPSVFPNSPSDAPGGVGWQGLPGRFESRLFSSEAGQRAYKVYIPAAQPSKPMPLLVMLHGCAQDADDFAAGTQMNALAETTPCVIVYPIQPQSANHSKCWNWFKPSDQTRGAGEPALIAGITRAAMAEFGADPARVYVAGLSAGGAMAAILIQAYPDLYAAAGVHSGLPAGSARDLPSALAAMRGGLRAKSAAPHAPARPVIVFHGDADQTVHPSNAADILRDFGAAAQRSEEGAATVEQSSRSSLVERFVAANGVEAERWTIRGAPHAWSGGSPRGSYTDPRGPDASALMMRFFLAHPLPAEHAPRPES